MLGLFTKEVIISSLISSVVIGGSVFFIKETEIREREVLIIEEAKKNRGDGLVCFDSGEESDTARSFRENNARSLERLREQSKGRQFFVPRGTPGAY